MDEREFLAERFEEHRTRLRAVAYRMLGSLSEADDAVQEAWLRLSRTDASEVENLAGWLTTVVARVSLNMLRSRNVAARGAARRSHARADRRPRRRDRPRARGAAGGLGRDSRCSWSSRRWPRPSGWRSCCTTSSPCPSTRSRRSSTARPRRHASSPAARAAASRAENTVPDADLDTQREVVDAFLAASRDGDFEALLAVLDPDVVLRADFGPCGGSREVRGAEAVAGQALGYSQLGLVMRPALVNGAAGAVSTRDGEPFSVGGITVRGGKIVEIDILADPERLRQLDLTVLDA